MPSDGHHLVTVLKCLNCRQLVKISSVSDDYLSIEASTCYILSINVEGDTSCFLRMCHVDGRAFPHSDVPEGQTAVSVANACQTWKRGVNSRIKGGILLECYFVHVSVGSAVNLTYLWLCSDIPDSNILVCANTHSEGAVSSHLDWIYASIVTFKVRDVFARLAVPHLHVFVIYIYILLRENLLRPPERSTKSLVGSKHTVLTIAVCPLRTSTNS